MYVSGDVRSDEDTRKAVETTVTAFGRLVSSVISLFPITAPQRALFQRIPLSTVLPETSWQHQTDFDLKAFVL